MAKKDPAPTAATSDSPTTTPTGALADGIHPIAGRRLHFRANGSVPATDALGIFDHGQPCDALVTYVWSTRLVNVVVTGPTGTVCNFSSMPLRQPGDGVPADGMCYVERMGV